jgi:hypothetical protein
VRLPWPVPGGEENNVQRVNPGRLAALAIASAAILATIAIALTLRLQDPSSTPVMAAEDPYTHMSLVREHLRDGVLQAQSVQGALYPPGLHAVIAAWWSFGGMELYDLMRFGPVVFGLVSVAGIAILLWRWEGALAAFAGALALATMPEEIHRTTMMSPTALDLALLPALFLTLLEVLRGRLAWVGAAVPITAFLVLAHPWILAVANLAGLAFLLLYLAFPWRSSRGPPVTREGVAAAVAVLGGGLGVALATRWEASGTGFVELTLPVAGYNAGLLGAAAVLAAGLLAAILLLLPRIVRHRLPALNRRKRPAALQVLGVLGKAALVAAITYPAVQNGMPDFVNLPDMLGWPVIILAVIGLLVLPLAGSPAAHVGAALFLATFPFAIHNPLDSPYWPHRTVVFLGVGVAILTGVAVQRFVEAWRPGVAGVWARIHRHRGANGSGSARPRSVAQSAGIATMAVVMPTLLVGTAYAGVMLAETPAPYQGGWYRLYPECEFQNLRVLGEHATEDPKALVITGSWQSQLVVSAFTDGVHRVWFKKELFTQTFDRQGWVGVMQKELRSGMRSHVYVVVDRHLPQEVDRADWTFLEADPWVLVKQDCLGQGVMRAKFSLYELRSG